MPPPSSLPLDLEALTVELDRLSGIAAVFIEDRQVPKDRTRVPRLVVADGPSGRERLEKQPLPFVVLPLAIQGVRHEPQIGRELLSRIGQVIAIPLGRGQLDPVAASAKGLPERPMLVVHQRGARPAARKVHQRHRQQSLARGGRRPRVLTAQGVDGGSDMIPVQPCWFLVTLVGQARPHAIDVEHQQTPVPDGRAHQRDALRSDEWHDEGECQILQAAIHQALRCVGGNFQVGFRRILEQALDHEGRRHLAGLDDPAFKRRRGELGALGGACVDEIEQVPVAFIRPERPYSLMERFLDRAMGLREL